jgi:GH35 family endo-1,4-beta-xylanase
MQAQLSTNPDKFLGNITTGWPGSMDWDGFTYSNYWNQVTPENSSKWGVVQGGGPNSWNWTGVDAAYKYAQQKGILFKFHCLVWGSQYPGWIKSLSAEARYEAIVKWMDAVKRKYPNLEMIDVVNEAVEGHQADTYLLRDALGGNGVTGYDWIIRAFEMAHERWPDAILIYNDFNTFQWNTDQFIDLVKTLRDAGAPIDAYGCQSHDLGGLEGSKFAAAMKKIQDAVKIPMYITEYDIGDTNDANQKWNFQQHFPLMWEADYCAGVTLWGWFYGHTWLKDDKTGENGISGLIKNKQERSALKWLREYMQTDKAKQARSPFPGMKKEASVYVKPSTLRAKCGEPMTIDVTAHMRTKTIESVALYINGQLIRTMTEAPYRVEYTPSESRTYTAKAVVTTTDGAAYERLSQFKAMLPLAIDKRFASLTAIGSTPFAIVSETDGKALYGSNAIA